MSDEADIAAENQQRLNDAALALRQEAAAERDSAEYCAECDDPIPERRRQAIPGVTRCVECQADEERRG